MSIYRVSKNGSSGPFAYSEPLELHTSLLADRSYRGELSFFSQAVSLEKMKKDFFLEIVVIFIVMS